MVALPCPRQLALDARITCTTQHSTLEARRLMIEVMNLKLLCSMYYDTCYLHSRAILINHHPILSYPICASVHLNGIPINKSTYSTSIFQHQQPLPLQSPQTIHIPTRLHDRLHRRLAQLPSLLSRLLLAARFRLATPARRHARQDLAAIVRREVDEAYIRRARLSWSRRARFSARSVEILMACLMAEGL